ncbi:MAG: ABC transporter ATP-binding protein [Halobacteriota archaeon]
MPSENSNEAATSTVEQEDRTWNAPTLEAVGIQHQFGDIEVLEQVDIDAAPGTVTALIGPNGSGKTTLLRILLGSLTPTGGTVSYTGPTVDRPIGYLPQQPVFRSRFTARETLSFYGSLVEADTDVDALLDRVGLSDAGDRPVEALSGGMNRLLGIAQSLVGDPPVVVFDEPASGLDPSMGRQAFEIIAEQADLGTAILVSSHDLSFVERFADRVAVLCDGEIHGFDTPEALRDRYDVDDMWEVYDAIVTEANGLEEEVQTR